MKKLKGVVSDIGLVIFVAASYYVGLAFTFCNMRSEDHMRDMCDVFYDITYGQWFLNTYRILYFIISLDLILVLFTPNKKILNLWTRLSIIVIISAFYIYWYLKI